MNFQESSQYTSPNVSHVAGVNLPNTLIFDYPTISAIADFTTSQMGPGAAPAGEPNFCWTQHLW